MEVLDLDAIEGEPVDTEGYSVGKTTLHLHGSLISSVCALKNSSYTWSKVENTNPSFSWACKIVRKGHTVNFRVFDTDFPEDINVRAIIAQRYFRNPAPPRDVGEEEEDMVWIERNQYIRSYNYSEAVNSTFTLTVEVFWQGRLELSKDWGLLLETRALADVTLLAGGEREGEGAEIRAHKLVLSARSPVFRAMFHSGLAESTKSQVSLDESRQVLEKVLLFVYTGKVDTDDLVGLEVELLAAAEKYDIRGLKHLCERQLARQANCGNVLPILALANKHNAEILLHSLVDFAVENIETVMEDDKWDEFVIDNPTTVGLILCKTVSLCRAEHQAVLIEI